MRERRRFLRISEEDAVTYEVIPFHKTARSVTRDLSIGGIRFFADEFIPMSSVLKVELQLKGANRVIRAIVKTKWIKQYYDDERYDLGAEFVDISREDLKFLDKYLYKQP